MRITARLDADSEHNLETIQKLKGLKSITDVLKYSLQQTVDQLEKQSKPGDRMKSLLDSDFVGSFKGPEDLSENYKAYVADALDEKYPQHTKQHHR